MAKLKITIHPFFLIYGIIVILCGLGWLFFCYITSVFLHELGHYFVAKKLGYKLENICFLPFGAELNIKQEFFKNHEILIAIAGPIVNLFLILVSLSIWWIFPETYAFLDDFVFANIIIGLFNLLPIYPLDGGRVLLGFLRTKINKKKAEKITFVIALCLSLGFFLLFLITLFSNPNFNLGIISFFLTTACLDFNKNAVYKHRFVARNYSKIFKNGNEVKIVAVAHTTPLFKLPLLLDSNHFCIFLVFNEKQKLCKVIFEQNLQNLFEKHPASAELWQI